MPNQNSSTTLVIRGPFDIPFDLARAGTEKHIGKSHIEGFWQRETLREIENKQGCYVFALRAGKGFTPWYVGKTTNSFRQECFQNHKLGHYNTVLFKRGKGTPVMFFACQPGTKKKIPAKTIDDMETYLIQTAIYKNPDITNVQKTKNLPSWGIRGVVRGGKGKVSETSRQFARMFGI